MIPLSNLRLLLSVSSGGIDGHIVGERSSLLLARELRIGAVGLARRGASAGWSGGPAAMSAAHVAEAAQPPRDGSMAALAHTVGRDDVVA